MLGLPPAEASRRSKLLPWHTRPDVDLAQVVAVAAVLELDAHRDGGAVVDVDPERPAVPGGGHDAGGQHPSPGLLLAARQGGGDTSMNPRLRLAIEKAKAANMPADRIKYNVDKASGNLEGANY